ncbi:hypothetical protein HK100_001373, partial [Physocladia obscura]
MDSTFVETLEVEVQIEREGGEEAGIGLNSIGGSSSGTGGVRRKQRLNVAVATRNGSTRSTPSTRTTRGAHAWLMGVGGSAHGQEEEEEEEQTGGEEEEDDDEVKVTLTATDDALLLWTLALRRPDFDVLRRAQSLVVSFDAFAPMLRHLLRAANPSNPTSTSKSNTTNNSPVLAALLSIKPGHSATLAFVETTAFRRISHLSLVLAHASDAKIKLHLAERVKNLMTESDTLRKSLASSTQDLEQKLLNQQSTSEELASKLETLQHQYSLLDSSLKLDFALTLSRQKDELLKDSNDMRASLDAERRQIIVSFEEKIRELTQELKQVYSTNSSSQTHITHLEATITALSTKLSNLESLHATTTEQLATQCETNQLLRTQVSGTDTLAINLQHRIATLETTLAERDGSIKTLETALHTATTTQSTLEQALASEREKTAALDEGFRTASDEINKGNEIIRKIQTDLKAAKAKIKLKNVVTLQQEKLLDERAAIIDLREKEAMDLKNTVATLSEEAKELKGKVEELSGIVDEGKKIIAENTHVIEWLHKQLNEDALSKPIATTTASSVLNTNNTYGFGKLDFDKFGSSTAAMGAGANIPSLTTTDKQHQPERLIQSSLKLTSGLSKYGGSGGGAGFSAATTSPVMMKKNVSPLREQITGGAINGGGRFVAGNNNMGAVADGSSGSVAYAFGGGGASGGRL